MAADATRGEVRIEELDRAQQVLARRVAEAKAIVPELSMRASAAAATVPEGATLRDVVIKAVAVALRETPRANAAYRDGHVELYSRVNVAFATPAGDGAVFPVLIDADARPLVDLAAEARALAEAAAAGTITAPQLGGATFTVVALDGVDEVTPVIAAPQAGTLGAGGVRDGLVTLTLVADARVLHGPVAAGFLGRVRTLLETPGEPGV
jgi:pyruvate dehydrogenase E2 component (dihydrolipoamide acetyltransferase)